MRFDLDAAPSLPNGWRIVRHDRQGIVDWHPSPVRLYVDRTQRHGGMAEGKALLRILRRHGACNATLLDRLLDRLRLIPAAWKGDDPDDAPFIHFWGTRFRDPAGIHCVRALHWNGTRWTMRHQWTGGLFHASDPALVFV